MAFMFAVSEYSPIDNSISLGITASEVDPEDLCCNEFGYIDCSLQLGELAPVSYEGALSPLHLKNSINLTTQTSPIRSSLVSQFGLSPYRNF